eukprot:scaffold17807_cov45-Phaeocystis_antarctica.AAC.1
MFRGRCRAVVGALLRLLCTLAEDHQGLCCCDTWGRRRTRTGRRRLSHDKGGWRASLREPPATVRRSDGRRKGAHADGSTGGSAQEARLAAHPQFCNESAQRFFCTRGGY